MALALAFDPKRRAIILCGGDRSGGSENYDGAVGGIARVEMALVSGENGMELHMLSGFLGTGIVAGGYISDLARLVRTHRAEGVSGRTYLLWAVASGLLLVHARRMLSLVFTVLTISQIFGCVLIATLATIFRRFESPGGGAGSTRPSAPDCPEP
jgi:hypothetical protein